MAEGKAEIDLNHPILKSQGARPVKKDWGKVDIAAALRDQGDKEVVPDNSKKEDGNGVDWLPWISAGGTGLIAHAIASSIFDDDDKEKNKSVWYRLLKTLIPLGAGAAGAYGGYRLADSMKMAQDTSAGGDDFDSIEVTPGDGYSYTVPNDRVKDYINLMEWAKNNGRTRFDSVTDSADQKEKNYYYGGLAAKWLPRVGYGFWDFYRLKPFFGSLFPEKADSFLVDKYTPAQIQAAREGIARSRLGPTLTNEQLAELEKRQNALRTAVDTRTYLDSDKPANDAARNEIKSINEGKVRNWEAELNRLRNAKNSRGGRLYPDNSRQIIDAERQLIAARRAHLNEAGVPLTTPPQEVLDGYARQIAHNEMLKVPAPEGKALSRLHGIIDNPGAKKISLRKFMSGIAGKKALRELTGMAIPTIAGEVVSRFGGSLQEEAARTRALKAYLRSDKKPAQTQPAPAQAQPAEAK